MKKPTRTQMEKIRAILERPLLAAGAVYEFIPPADIGPWHTLWVKTFLKGKHNPRSCYFDELIQDHRATCLIGSAAEEAYRKQYLADYIIFGRDGVFGGYRCSGPYPDYRGVPRDIYIAHHNMKWTMVYTHEKDLGPYFLQLR